MDFHVFTTHQRRDDSTPLQLISAELLAYYRSLEASALRAQRWVKRRGGEDTRCVQARQADNY
jgi:hypothetical protein